ncbi:uncharacterized protein LOC112027250 [Quercus suber]|uniref:uncharacterized protein LOC112027250 n=1 Tax=Quercus suber TaxID=58331 RepID=UPI0032E0514B
MGLLKLPLLVLLCWVFSLLSLIALCDDSELTVKFLKAPHIFSHLSSATFVFEVLEGGNGSCTNCNITCKLDDGFASDCEGRMVLHAGLQDGNHTFEVCTNGSGGVGCANYNWTVDTVPPTAYITASTPFTNALNVSINISFSEPCTGGGGFVCSSVNACNLLVYGAGQVIPSSLNILQPNLQYSILVGLSSTSHYGRAILVMDKNFCTDSAGNKFTRNANSTFFVHFDRRSVFVNLRIHVPERPLQLNGETRLVQATNNYKKLKVYLYFSEPILNSSAEILNSLQISQGTLLPVSGNDLGNRRFGFMVANLSGMAIVTLSINSNSIISRQGTPVSQVAPVTFLYGTIYTSLQLDNYAMMVVLHRRGSASEIIVGILLLGAVSFLLLVLLLFLSIGITFAKLLQYKEVHQVGRRFHWYQEIVRVTLGPGKRGQWTWKNQQNSNCLTMLGPLFEDLRGPPKYMLSQISGGSSLTHGDRIIASDDETEDAEAPFIQKLFGILRIYYTLLESVRRVSLGTMAGAYKEKWSSKTPTIILLCITSFQLFFLVLKKPFIKKKVQLVEIISVTSEVALFAICFVLLEKEFSARVETIVGVFMLILFLVGYLPQMMNEWCALYRQTKQLDSAEKSFLTGLKIASIGLVLLFIPHKFLESRFPVNGHHGDGETNVTNSSAERNRNSGSRNSGTTVPEKSWLKQLRELAKASFSKDESGAPSDPSTSRARWSGFWGTKGSGSPTLNASSDFKSNPSGLYKDLEAIFASK